MNLHLRLKPFGFEHCRYQATELFLDTANCTLAMQKKVEEEHVRAEHVDQATFALPHTRPSQLYRELSETFINFVTGRANG